MRVLSVSDGEPPDPRCYALASARREELNEALRKLCPTHVAVTRLGLPLGKINQHANRVRNALLSLASGEVMLVAPNDHAGHPDREAVGRVCVEFARAQGFALARYGIGRYGIGPAGSIARDGAAQDGAARGSEARWVKFVLSDEARRAKARAVQCFRARSDSRRGRSVASARSTQAPQRAYEAFLV